MVSLLLALLVFSSSLVQAARIHGLLLDDNFPSPSIIAVNDVYYAFSSRSSGRDKTTNIPMATSERFISGWKMIKGDALQYSVISLNKNRFQDQSCAFRDVLQMVLGVKHKLLVVQSII